NTLILSPLTTISSHPSPSMSASFTLLRKETGVETETAAANEITPGMLVFCRIDRVLPLELATTISGKPSPLRSAIAISTEYKPTFQVPAEVNDVVAKLPEA